MPLGMFGRVAVLAAIALIAGAGLCLFDGHDAASGGACPSFLQRASGLSLASPLTLTGYILPGFASAYHLYPPDLPAPPPKV